MPYFLYEKCWRGRDDCRSVHCIDAEPDGLSHEEVNNFDYTPLSFVCCGVNTESSRELKRDAFRLCFKNSVVDDISDNDEQDLTSIMAVVSNALLYHALLKVNGGSIEIPLEK